MTEYDLGYAIGQITIGIIVLWLGVKGITQKGIPLTKKHAIRGCYGKIIGLILAVCGAFGLLNGLVILLS